MGTNEGKKRSDQEVLCGTCFKGGPNCGWTVRHLRAGRVGTGESGCALSPRAGPRLTALARLVLGPEKMNITAVTAVT